MAALRLSEERFQTAMSIMPIAVFHLDRELRYTWFHNPLLPGLSPDDFIGRTGAEFFEAKGYERRVRLFRRVLETGETGREEMILRSKSDGKARTFDHTVAPLRDKAGRIIGLTCAVIDISDKVYANEALRCAMDRARRADEAKSRFLSAANHDLRQPLQAMRLYLEALDAALEDPEHRAILNGAMAAQNAGEELLRNYLDVSLLDSDITPPALHALPMAPLLNDLAAECVPIAQKKRITVRVAPTSAHVVSDARLLGQMLRCLLLNAIRFTERGGVLMGCRHHQGRLRVEVWDTGPGIPEDKLSVVFEDFYQLANPERDRTKGFGLGLGVVQRAARLLGHDVTVASTPGRGTMFAVTLPLATSMADNDAINGRLPRSA
ncbi:MAG: ATP-binding protein [Magnetospirillum sp.]|nr:ATP-binding protein [Magnetospirillum sp.]